MTDLPRSATIWGIPIVFKPEVDGGFRIVSVRVEGEAESTMWFACSEPERPTDPYVIWHYDNCRGCRIKAQLVLEMNPDTRIGASLIHRMDHGHWPERER